MADNETGEPRVDNETGEERDTLEFPALVRGRRARTLQVTVSTDRETGENEWHVPVPVNTTPRSNTFHVPPSALQGSNARLVAHILCLLPALIFFPALTVSLCVFTEICIHCWFHSQEFKCKSNKIPRRCHKTPLELVIKAFCNHCQYTRVFPDIEDERNQKLKGARMKFKTSSLCAVQS